MAKSYRLALLVLLLLSSVVAAQSKRERFDPDGSFWVLGETPAAVSGFGGINLNRKRVRHLPTSGVDEMNGRRFPFKTLTVKREQFAFTTVTVRGVSYSFKGKFLRGGIYQQAQLDDEKPILEGTLQKFVSGKKVAEAQLKFIYFGGT